MINIRKLLLENTGIKQTVVKNTFWLTLAEVIVRILGLVLIVFVTRILGATEYGKFAFAFSFVSIMVIFSDLGIVDIAIREFSRNKDKEKELPSIITLNIILKAGALILMAIGSFFITSDFFIRRLIWILSIFVLISSFFGIFCSFLRSRQKMEYEAGFMIVQSMIMTGLSFFVIFHFPSAVNLSYSYLFSNLFLLIVFLLFFHFYFQPLRLDWDKNIFKLLKISWPLSLGFMTSWIYISINSVMLGYFNLITENGWYSAAAKIALAAVIPANLVLRSFYPVLSNFFVISKEKFQKSWDYLMGSMIFLVAPITVGGITLAPRIINFFYASGFDPSIFALQLLILVVAISFINYPYSIVLVVSDHQKKNFFLIASGIAINIVLDILLIPIYGLYGAIISAIISSALILFSTIIAVKYFIGTTLFSVKLLKDITYAGFSGLAMFFVISFPPVYNLNIFLSVIIGGLVYCLILSLFYNTYRSFLKNIQYFGNSK